MQVSPVQRWKPIIHITKKKSTHTNILEHEWGEGNWWRGGLREAQLVWSLNAVSGAVELTKLTTLSKMPPAMFIL